MAVQISNLQLIHEFLAQKRIALAGVSRNPNDFSAKLFQEFCRRGFDMVPVNPAAKEILGKHCFHRVQDIQPPVTAVLLMTSPEITEIVVNDCAEAGVDLVWMHRAVGAGSVSAKAIAFCHSHGIRVIAGECPFMFLPNGEFVHKLHGFIRKITGNYPRATAA